MDIMMDYSYDGLLWYYDGYHDGLFYHNHMNYIMDIILSL